MKSKNFKVEKIAFILLFLLLSQRSFACRCSGVLSPETAYNRADLVVLGSVASIQGSPYLKGGAKAKIDVKKIWKESLTTPLEIRTSTSCAFDLKLGGEYLLYLYPGRESNQYIIRACQGNGLASESKSSIRWLEKHGNVQKMKNTKALSALRPCSDS